MVLIDVCADVCLQVEVHVEDECTRGSTEIINMSVMYPGHYPKMVLNIRNRIFKSVKFLATLEMQLINSVITEFQLLSRVTVQ
jgi:hypothetical protein